MPGYIDNSSDLALFESYSQGRALAGARLSNLSEFAQWSALLDGNTCDWCSWADLRIFDTSIEPYDPPMHHGCRCIIAYITADEFPPTEDWGQGPPPETWPPGRVKGELDSPDVGQGPKHPAPGSTKDEELRELANRRSGDGTLVGREVPEGGARAEVRRYEIDGEDVIVKHYPYRAAEEAREAIDREVLGYRVAEAVDAPSPRVVALDERTLVQRHATITGKADALDALDGGPADWAEGAKETGLLDWLIGNNDRHGLNWFYDRKAHKIEGIDLGEAFTDVGSRAQTGYFKDPDSPFTRVLMTFDSDQDFTSRLVSGVRRISKGTYTAEELAGVEARLLKLAPDFEALGRSAWYEEMMLKFKSVQDVVP